MTNQNEIPVHHLLSEADVRRLNDYLVETLNSEASLHRWADPGEPGVIEASAAQLASIVLAALPSDYRHARKLARHFIHVLVALAPDHRWDDPAEMLTEERLMIADVRLTAVTGGFADGTRGLIRSNVRRLINAQNAIFVDFALRSPSTSTPHPVETEDLFHLVRHLSDAGQTTKILALAAALDGWLLECRQLDTPKKFRCSHPDRLAAQVLKIAQMESAHEFLDLNLADHANQSLRLGLANALRTLRSTDSRPDLTPTSLRHTHQRHRLTLSHSVAELVAFEGYSRNILNSLLKVTDLPGPISASLRLTPDSVPPALTTESLQAELRGTVPHTPQQGSPPMPAKTASRAAKLRRQAELNAAAETPSKMPAFVVNYINDWVPHESTTTANWSTTGPVTRDIMLASSKTSKDAAAKCITVVALHAEFCRARGVELTAESILKSDLIDEFFRVGLDAERYTDKTRKDYRSRLRGLATPYPTSGVEPKTVVGEYSKVRRPYNDAELAEIWENVRIQPNPVFGAQLRTTFLLGVGVGASSADMRDIGHTDIDDRGADGIWVTLRGLRASGQRKVRTVPMLSRYEDDLRIALADLPAGRGTLLQGKTDRQNITYRLVEKGYFSEGAAKPVQARLRSTWLAIQVVQPIPFLDLMKASGLGSSRSLTDIVSYLDIDEVQPVYLREVE